jgi:hypothetical protein
MMKMLIARSGKKKDEVYAVDVELKARRDFFHTKTPKSIVS